MDHTASPSPDPDAARRRSARVVKAPRKFTPEPLSQPLAAKRKRSVDRDGEGVENDPPELPLDENTSDEMDGDSAADEPPPARKQNHRSSRPRKPAMKKVKTGDGTSDMATSHAASLPSRPKKSVRIEGAAEGGTGLYADIFGSGESPGVVATQWLGKFQADNDAAVTELINCILRCAGCDLDINEDDIRDPENCQNRLTDLQSVFQDQHITEYPLVSKARGTKPFRELLVSFFDSLVKLLHETELLYIDQALMSNVHIWVATMSSSTLRPFRHTATTIALAIQTGLVHVAAVLDKRITSIEHQIQAGQRGRNKTKLAEMQQSLDEANSSRETCQEQIKDFFDTVFVHRYRDIDPKIRTECVEALGNWIAALPTVFMMPEYLRYLGWMLSDIMHSTRQEVLRQLHRIFKSHASQIGHFVDRFRPRLIEMATKDSEVSVRVTAISVAETLRDTGLMEPNELDTMGKLIFDSELRVRKAVVPFFIACVKDLIESKTEELGGSDAFEELFGAVEEDDYDSPRQEWVNIKCLAENLSAYDAQIEDQEESKAHGLEVAAEILHNTLPDTRITLASQVLYEKIPEVKEWQMLAGYLLHDHTMNAKERSRSRSKLSRERVVQNAVAPDEHEELILLQILVSAAKQSLSQPTEVDRSKKKLTKADAADAQEDTALQVASIIPRLLNRFGADAEMATVILRLEHALDLDVFQQLRQDQSIYEKILDEISTQFNRHGDKKLLTAAAAALLHARQYDELEELADSKLDVLWEDAVNLLRNFDKIFEVSARGNLEATELMSVSNTLMKISRLASISDCVDVLEAEGRSADSSASVIELLVAIVHRGRYDQIDTGIDDLEDEVASFAITACQFYFMWKVQNFQKLLDSGADVPAADIDNVIRLKKTYWNNLVGTFISRSFHDEIQVYSAGAFCDLHVLLSSLRPSVNRAKARGSATAQRVASLIAPVDPGSVQELIFVFDNAEKAYAKRSKKTLNEPAEDEDPIDDDDEDDDSAEDEAQSTAEKMAKELKAEKVLCELAGKYVLAITAHVLDRIGPQPGKLQKRLLRNQAKLGPNYKEVVAYLDAARVAQLLGGKKKVQKARAVAVGEPVAEAGAGQTSGSKASAKTTHLIVDDDDELFDEMEPEEGSLEDLRRRELLDDVVGDDDGEGERDVEHRIPEFDDVLGD